MSPDVLKRIPEVRDPALRAVLAERVRHHGKVGTGVHAAAGKNVVSLVVEVAGF